MNVICSICSDQLTQTDDIFYTPCGHVFHLHCITPWLERSKSCPQCREKVTQNRIHRLYFTFSSTESQVEYQGNTLQGKIDSLKFQLLLKEKDIQHYSSKNVTLEKQNAGLKQEVRKVESEITKKNSAIYALKEQMNYFKEQSSKCDALKRENAQLKRKLEDLRPIQVLLHAPVSDVNRMVGDTKDPHTLMMYISIMKKELIESFDKCKRLKMSIKRLKEQTPLVNTKSNTLLDDSSHMDMEEKLAISESKNMALQRRVDELEEILGINEKCNSVSVIQETNCTINTCKESAQENVPEKDNQNSRSKESKKRKIHKTSIDTNDNVESMEYDHQMSGASDSDVDLVNCSSSKSSPVVVKRLNPTIRSENKISNSTSKKRSKNNVKKKIFDETNHNNNSVIDLT